MASDKVLLLETLEELAREELKRFQWFLTHDMVNGFHPIPRSKLENANRMDTVDCMVQTYNTDGALRITMEILRKMNLNLLAVNLYASSKHRPDKEGAAVAVVLDDKQDESHKQDVEKKVLQLLKECQPEDALKIIKKVQRELNLHEVVKP
ncbi:hypothetical protein UPYG_G00130360 [Umbra pygmaea]|uniref:Pyrin domain-containing protein n=1 Tax=Umbra pygmaea TaxID=75934 RepID=A0ABD0XWE6_UMBPY